MLNPLGCFSLFFLFFLFSSSTNLRELKQTRWYHLWSDICWERDERKTRKLSLHGERIGLGSSCSVGRFDAVVTLSVVQFRTCTDHVSKNSVHVKTCLVFILESCCQWHLSTITANINRIKKMLNNAFNRGYFSAG